MEMEKQLLEGNAEERDAQVLAVSGGKRLDSDTHLDGSGGEGAVGGRESGAEGVAEGETESGHRLVVVQEDDRPSGSR
jgi:hypothetical protein